MTGAFEGDQPRGLTLADIPAAVALCEQSGWNQTADDWRLMIEYGTSFAQFEGDSLIATTVVLPYAHEIAWIAMVLTERGHRGQGLATRNLHRALAVCRERGWLAGLDAAPAGRPIYTSLGLREVFGLHRLIAHRPRTCEPPTDVAVRRLDRPAHLASVVAQDGHAFGAERPHLIDFLCRAQPERALIAEAGGRPTGCVFARPGRLSLHVGPLLAESTDVAVALLMHALHGCREAVSIDVLNERADFLQLLGNLGFVRDRPFTRMVAGDPMAAGHSRTSFAIAGPEFG